MMKEIVANFKPKINRELKTKIDEKIKKVSALKPIHTYYYEVLSDFVLRGGKRLRPASFVMAAKGVGATDEATLIKAACSVEFLHNGTLVHDDVMDLDEVRRGGPTCYVMFSDWHKKHFGTYDQKFGESIAILLGDTTYSLAEEMLLDSDIESNQRAEALKQLSHYYQVVCEGQLYDMMLEKAKAVTEEEYLTMVNMKTGVLFVAPLIMGASLGGASKAQLAALEKYGELMGQAFQIQDDVMGTFGDEAKSGKPTDGDIKEGKRTLLVIKALEAATSKQKETLLNALGNRRATAEQVEAVREIIRKTGSLDYSKKIAKELADKSKVSLKEAGLTNESTEFFSQLADYVIEREV